MCSVCQKKSANGLIFWNVARNNLLVLILISTNETKASYNTKAFISEWVEGKGVRPNSMIAKRCNQKINHYFAISSHSSCLRFFDIKLFVTFMFTILFYFFLATFSLLMVHKTSTKETSIVVNESLQNNGTSSRLTYFLL